MANPTTPLLDALLTGPLGQELGNELEEVYAMQRQAEEKAKHEELSQMQRAAQEARRTQEEQTQGDNDRELQEMNHLQAQYGEAWQEKYREMKEQKEQEQRERDLQVEDFGQEASASTITESKREELKRKLKPPSWIMNPEEEEERGPKRPFIPQGAFVNGLCAPSGGMFNEAIFRQFGTVPRKDPPKLQKTMMCKFFLKGKCSRSTGCTFAHDRNELKARPDFFKTRLCPDFRDTGKCIMGEDCGYAHTEEEIRAKPRTDTPNFAPSPQMQMQQQMQQPMWGQPNPQMQQMMQMQGQHGGVFTPMMQAAVGHNFSGAMSSQGAPGGMSHLSSMLVPPRGM